MKPISKLAAIGGYQPFLFCAGMYILSLFFSIFICSAIFYVIHPKTNTANQAEAKTTPAIAGVSANTAKSVMLTINN
jgi:hypothetical protein